MVWLFCATVHAVSLPVANPDFEKGRAGAHNGWSAGIEIVTDAPHSGKQCGRQSYVPKNWNHIYSEPAACRLSQGYQLYVWCRNTPKNASVGVYVREIRYDANKKEQSVGYTKRALLLPGRGEWQRAELSFTTQTNTEALAVYLGVNSENESGDIFWDDIVLVEKNEFWSWNKNDRAFGREPEGFIREEVRGRAELSCADSGRNDDCFALIMSNDASSISQWTLPAYPVTYRGTFDFSAVYSMGGTGSIMRVVLQGLDLYDNPVGEIITNILCDGVKSEWETMTVRFETPMRAAKVRPVIKFKTDAASAVLRVTRADMRQVSKLTFADIESAKSADANWDAWWLVSPGMPLTSGPAHINFRKRFTVKPNVRSAQLQLTADDSAKIYMNGELIGEVTSWAAPLVRDISKYCNAGDNVIAVDVYNSHFSYGLLGEMIITYDDGTESRINTDNSWKVLLGDASAAWRSTAFDDSTWRYAEAYYKVPGGPWGDRVPYTASRSLVFAVDRTTIPVSIPAGNILRYDVHLSPLSRIAGDIDFVVKLTQKGNVFSENSFHMPIPAGGVPAKSILTLTNVSIAVPAFIASGAYDVVLYPRYGTIQGASGVPNVIGSVAVNGRETVTQHFPDSAIVKSNGQVRLIVNGREINQTQNILGFGSKISAAYMENLNRSGIDVWPLFIEDFGFKGEGQFDYRETDAKIARYLEFNPQAYIILQLELSGKKQNWWATANPGECTVDASGNTAFPYAVNETGKQTYPSWMSKKFRTDTGDALRRLIIHAKASPYADRIIGIKLGNGITHEWLYWSSGMGNYPDYSIATRDAYRAWLRRKYSDRTDALRAAWRSPTADFASVQIPSKDKRENTRAGYYRAPVAEQEVIDFEQFFSYFVGFDSMEYFCRTIKEASDNKLLTGVYFGYNMYLTELGERSHTCSQFDMRSLMRSPYVDMCYGPTPYGYTRYIGGAGSFMTSVGSFNLWNKIWIQEADYRTYYYPQTHQPGTTLSDVVNIFRRELAQDIAFNVEQQYFDWENMNIFGDVRMADEIARIRKVREFSMRFANEGPRQVAVFVDDSSLPYTAHSSNYSIVRSCYLNGPWDGKIEFLRSGVKCDYYALSDIEHPSFPFSYKAYFFQNVDQVNERQREIIASRIKKDRSICVFYYGAGALDERGEVSAEHVSAMTGMRMAMNTDHAAMRSRLTDASHPLLRNIEPFAFNTSNYNGFYNNGTTNLIAPYFHVSDPAATALGVYADNGNISMAVKNMPAWTSIYSGPPARSPRFVRNVARLAGLHVYNESDDAVYIADHFIGMYAMSAGDKTITLPDAKGVYDVYGRKRISDSTAKIMFYAEENTAYLFFIGDVTEAERFFGE